MINILLRGMHCKPTGMHVKQPVTPHWPLSHADMHHYHSDAFTSALIIRVLWLCVQSLHMTIVRVVHQGAMLHTLLKNTLSQ